MLHRFIPVALLFCLRLALAAPSDKTGACCAALARKIPGRVFFPGSEQYELQQNVYYNSEQTDLLPDCRVAPLHARQVSSIVKIARQKQCNFAVKSGGHAGWKGSSNVGPGGFTIDLQNLTRLSISDDETVASIEPGLRWTEVYDQLIPRNITVTGGRVIGVGVGGYLVGGGLGWLSYQEGWSSSNIINYEAVLSSGELVSVNEESHPDLYWALKMGSTNYAIVTKFDMKIYPQGPVWGGATIHDISVGIQPLTYLINFTEKLRDDPKGMSYVTYAWDPINKVYGIVMPHIYLLPEPFPDPLFSELPDIPATNSTLRITDFNGVARDIRGTAPEGQRAQWFSFTYTADAQVSWDIFVKGQELFEPYLESVEGFSWGITVQPLANSMFVVSETAAGGNPSGLDAADGDLFLFLGTSFWANATDDALVYEKTAEYIQLCESILRERGLLNPFNYINYAFGGQDIYRGFGDDNFRRMAGIKKRYDPQNVYGRQWKGGFKVK